MPMLLGAKGKDILQWRASADLVATLKGAFDHKWGRSSATEAEALLRRFIESLGEELDYETQLKREMTALDEGFDEAESPASLKPLLARYREVVSAHFRRRQSVLALCDICNGLHDRAASKALSLAGERMRQLGQAPPLHALLICGDRGRGEQTLQSENHYFLLHEDDASSSFLLSRHVSAALKEAGLLDGEHMFRHGPLSLWRNLLGESVTREERSEGAGVIFGEGREDLPERERRLEVMTDLLPVYGAEGLAAAAVDAAGRVLAEERNRGAFMQLARRVITLPLALGRFGRWRLEREGEHRGELNLQQLAIDPLVMIVRVMAVHAGVASGGTVERIQALLEKGALPVELSERLLKAYQCLMQLRILSEIRSEQSGAFCSVEELELSEDERLRFSIETVLDLQKIAYQRMVGLG